MASSGAGFCYQKADTVIRYKQQCLSYETLVSLFCYLKKNDAKS